MAMKLIQIKIEKLFGTFNHKVNLNKSGITIILGENGLGKTVLLEMIEAFFKGKYFYFNQIAFNKMTLKFSDGVVWDLIKEEIENDIPQLSVLQTNINGTTFKPYKLSNYQQDELHRHPTGFSKKYPYLQRIGVRKWVDQRTGRIFTSAEEVQRYNKIVQYNLQFGDEDQPKWFSNRHDEINASLIETQRLITVTKKRENAHEKTVEKYSKELSQLIKSHLTKSTELSSKLDRTYPNRLIERLKGTSNVTDKHLHSELKNLEEKRGLLDKVGLIEIETESDILEIDKTEEVIKDVLMLYVEDSFKKIEIFDEISHKIQILLEIINKRFKHKKLHIDKEDGFLLKSTIIKDEDGSYQRIPATKLSSGEQNELVLFYLLLFDTKSNSLILIDEPEVSLHISWQNSFIEDLKEITELNNLDVIIATHSPDIISNNWNLKTELQGIE